MIKFCNHLQKNYECYVKEMSFESFDRQSIEANTFFFMIALILNI